MATAKFIAGPVARSSATASGKVTPAVATGVPSERAPASIAGSEASEDCVETATAWLGSTAFEKRGSDTRPPIIAIG